MLCPSTHRTWTSGSSLGRSWCSPADIYTEGILIIDDGYDRAKLNVPGILHIECAAKWSQARIARPLQRLHK